MTVEDFPKFPTGRPTGQPVNYRCLRLVLPVHIALRLYVFRHNNRALIPFLFQFGLLCRLRESSQNAIRYKYSIRWTNTVDLEQVDDIPRINLPNVILWFLVIITSSQNKQGIKTVKQILTLTEFLNYHTKIIRL